MLVHILWACVFLKTHASESVNAILVSGANNGKPVDEETFRKWSWCFVEKTSSPHNKVIVWENRHMGDIGNACSVTVDGTDFRIFEPTPFWSIWRSHKVNGPALRCELAVCIQTGSVVWTNGPCAQSSTLVVLVVAMEMVAVVCGGGGGDGGSGGGVIGDSW